MSQPDDDKDQRPPSTPEAPRPPGGSDDVIPQIRHPGALVPFVYERLRKALGNSKGAEVMRQVLTSFVNRPVESPQDLLDFAERLLRLGPKTQPVGRSLKVDAILRGASEKR